MGLGFCLPVCTCLFFYQLVQILPNYIFCTIQDVPLKEMDFPLNFKVCLRPSVFNNTAVKELGYSDSSTYIVGKSDFNDSQVIGWDH